MSRGHDARADDGVLSDPEQFTIAVADQRQIRFALNNFSGNKFHRLIEAVHACWFHAGRFELLDCVLLRGVLSTAPGVAAFHFVIG